MRETDTTLSAPAVELFDRLSPRQRECLRQVYHRRTSKEIAFDLGLGVGTVDTYISEAIALLKARNRRHAAEMLHAFEASEDDPRKVQYQSTGVAAEGAGMTPGHAEAQPFALVRLLPFRIKGVSANDIDPSFRFLWIAQLGISVAVGFGMLVVGLGVLSGFLR